MHSSIVIIVITALFTSAISLYLSSMDVRRSMWLCLVTGLPGKEYWDVRRCRPTRRSTRKIMRKGLLYFNRDGMTGFHFLNILTLQNWIWRKAFEEYWQYTDPFYLALFFCCAGKGKFRKLLKIRNCLSHKTIEHLGGTLVCVWVCWPQS